MRVDVMQHYGFTQPLSHAGYYATEHHRQRMTDIKNAILEGYLIAGLDHRIGHLASIRPQKIERLNSSRG